MATFVWDVPLKETKHIKYFDPELTYEATKYRPITETRGLDFVLAPFVEAGTKKRETGRYTDIPHRSKTHYDWWKEQFRRCREGYESNGYRVTGDHYFFLNFYVLQNIQNVQKAGEGREETLPNFWAKHYEYFHYIELCEILGKDVIAFKARGVGFSEIAVCLGVRPYTTTPNYQTVYTAFSENLLEPTLAKAWTQLEYLNTETEGAMKRLRQNINSNMHKQASKKDKENNVTGHKSEIRGIIVDNPRKLRGRRIDRLIYEEAGSNPILAKTYIKGEALVELLGKKIGTRVVFGTGGDEGPPLAALEEMFLDPVAFGGLPYKHRHTRDGEYALTGYFVPAHACMVDLMDERGVTNEQAARDYYNTKRKALAHLPDKLIDHCAEFCFFPEEGLSKQGQNNFNQILLAEQYTQIQIHKTVSKPTRGRLFWNKDKSDNIVGVKWVEDPAGPILISEHPIIDEDTNKPKTNLYVGGIDAIDLGADESVVGDRGSDFAIVIKRRQHGLSSSKYVCMYAERPKDVRTAYTNAAMILWYYGCKANLEETKISFRTWLREKKWDSKMLMTRPEFALNPLRKKKAATLWGTPGSEKMINHGLTLIASFIEDSYNTIDCIEMLEQLQKFSYEFKGKYDIVMAMVYCEIGDEDMYSLKVDPIYRSPDTWKDIGYYLDNKGYRRYGVIENNQKSNLSVNEEGKIVWQTKI